MSGLPKASAFGLWPLPTYRSLGRDLIQFLWSFRMAGWHFQDYSEGKEFRAAGD